MDFLWNEEQEQIRDAVERACAPFDADYWLRKDHEGGFPHDFHKALADAGWLGIAMPEEFGGAGLGSRAGSRSEEHTSELQSQSNLVCRLLLEKKKRS